MINFIKIILFIGLLVGSYFLGSYRSKIYYEELNNKLLAESVDKFNTYVANEKAKQEDLERSIKSYESINNELSVANADLLMRIKNSSSTKCTLSNSKTQSDIASRDKNRRDTTLEDVLREATIIISERDKIANLYNELREQCKLN